MGSDALGKWAEPSRPSGNKDKTVTRKKVKRLGVGKEEAKGGQAKEQSLIR